ncbi:toxin-antitoxin system YwqK family antitoxin [Paraburkholderia mimosarum]|uniref:toxin-antitoxin system YwqK family antitoxin n=1 Tax=Paraburkholderia mimosarum TaxID=312026 RepID=UPI0004889F5D|nr:toxin-antitoxin system YwqK family antitoxin [Paraburkholderia mimosarum]
MKTIQPLTIERDGARIEGATLGGALHGPVRIESDQRAIATLRYANGVLSGPATYFYPEGNPSAQAQYVNGKLDGKTLFYFPDGKVQREAHYAAGALHGVSRTWLPDGTLLEEAHYRNGKLHGVLQRFHPNGCLSLRQPFSAGKPMEAAKRYTDDGRPIAADGKPLARWKQWWQALVNPSST